MHIVILIICAVMLWDVVFNDGIHCWEILKGCGWILLALIVALNLGVFN